MRRTAERVTAVVGDHLEGPFWDEVGRRLLCLDVHAASVVAIESSGSVTRHEVPGTTTATAIRRREAGGFVIAAAHELLGADDALRRFESIARFESDPSIRANDGGCDPLGGFVIGTMVPGGLGGAGAVRRIAPDASVSTLVTSASIPNGVQWSSNGRTVFWADSANGRIDAFDFDRSTGAWSGRRPHLEIPPAAVPDGLAIDEADGLWVACWGGEEIRHYDVKGRLVEEIAVPGVGQVSSCAFGGDDLRTLFITTSREGLAPGESPDAGTVFAVQTKIRGAVPHAFAG